MGGRLYEQGDEVPPVPLGGRAALVRIISWASRGPEARCSGTGGSCAWSDKDDPFHASRVRSGEALAVRPFQACLGSDVRAVCNTGS